MKKIYKLCNYQFIQIGKRSLFICAALLIFQLVALSSQSIGNNEVRMEQHMQRLRFDLMFLIAYMLILIIIAVSVYQKYFGSKSIYTILSLPVDRSSVYFSFIIPGVIAVLLLCFTQVISVHLSYQIVLGKLAENLPETWPDGSVPKVDYMNNAVFLAFARYGYLRLLLPLDLIDLARSICLLIAPVISVVYFAFCERSRKFGGVVLVLLQIILLWTIVGNINNTSITTSYTTTIVCICISIFCAFVCAFLNYRLIKNKAII